MGLINIDGILLKKMIIAGSNNLLANKQILDDLNVFPVPDGDTGTNMSLTVWHAAKEVEKLNTPNVYDVAKAASNGALRGARGNSGVILSQLFRGFAKGLSGVSIANVFDLVNALTEAQFTAYNAVMKPKEGTILTLAKEIALKATELSFNENDIEKMLNVLCVFGGEVLSKTTEMLPELKYAGVVDAGAKGLLCVLSGALQSLSIEGDIVLEACSTKQETNSSVFKKLNTEDIKYAYCSEIIVIIDKQDKDLESNMKSFLNSIGDSIVLVLDDNLMKIHVHTNHPGKLLEKGLTYGMLSNIKIENMKEQHTSKLSYSEKSIDKANQAPPKETGFLAVSVGDGFKKIFKDYGADFVLEGGQTMNPSTEDILEAINKINAKNVIVLPNNKNIILAAEQATKLCTDKNVFVVPTKSIPQGISALVNQIPTNSVQDNLKCMNETIMNVKTGQITYAVRETVFEDKQIKIGDILCIDNGKIAFVCNDRFEGAKKLINEMTDDESSYIAIYYGIDTKKEEAENLKQYIEDQFPDCDVELYNGEQPLYYYYFSVE